MNYQAGSSLAGGYGLLDADPRIIPVGTNWKRVNFALAGFGYVVPGTISDPVTATIAHAAQKTCTITHSVKGA